MDQSRWADPPPTTSVAEEEATDAFAQTGSQQDDLFDDIVPALEQMRLRSDDDLFSEDFTPVPQPVPDSVPPETREAPAEASRARGRGRGRARGPREGRGGQPRNGPRAQARDNDGAKPKDANDASKSSSDSAAAAQGRGQAPENAPSGPRRGAPRAVRGDRQDTGGIRRPKLTEEELAEKMARIQVKNASLTAAHARAEADAASFAEREHQAKKQAEERRRVERRDQQQMNGEREKNRMRKLKAMEGREWDADKQEQDFGKGAKFDKPGAFAGDQKDYSDGREYLYREPRHGHRGSGNRRGNHAQPATQAVPTKEEFPALPAQNSTSDTATNLEAIPPSDAGTKGSWAEQVESSVGI